MRDGGGMEGVNFICQRFRSEAPPISRFLRDDCEDFEYRARLKTARLQGACAFSRYAADFSPPSTIQKPVKPQRFPCASLGVQRRASHRVTCVTLRLAFEWRATRSFAMFYTSRGITPRFLEPGSRIAHAIPEHHARSFCAGLWPLQNRL